MQLNQKGHRQTNKSKLFAPKITGLYSILGLRHTLSVSYQANWIIRHLMRLVLFRIAYRTFPDLALANRQPCCSNFPFPFPFPPLPVPLLKLLPFPPSLLLSLLPSHPLPSVTILPLSFPAPFLSLSLPFSSLPLPPCCEMAPHNQLGGLGRCKLPQRGPGGAPAEVAFCCIVCLQNASGCSINRPVCVCVVI